MSTKPSLFDDSDEDGEYVPQSQEQTTNATDNSQPVQQQEPVQQVEAHVQQQEVQQQQQTQEETSYQPVYDQQPEQQQQQNPYTQQQDQQQQYNDQYQPTYDNNQQQNNNNVNPYQSAPVDNNNQQTSQPVMTNQQVFDNIPHTEAEKQLEAQTDLVQNSLMSQIATFEKTTQERMPVKDVEQDPRVAQFQVKNPIKMHGHVRYLICGVDSQGAFEDSRRFKEFFALRKCLVERWPGIYIPAIPEKKFMSVEVNKDPRKWAVQDNFDAKFVVERTLLLEKFIKEIAKYEFLVESKEFKLFSRGQGEIDKQMTNLPGQRPTQILEKYRQNFKIDEDQKTEQMAYVEKINVFTAFLKKNIAAMKQQKKQLKSLKTTHSKQMESYPKIFDQFIRYENTAMEFYADKQQGPRTFTHPAAGNGDLPNTVRQINMQIINPYVEAYVWFKNELYTMESMLDALNGREAVQKACIACEKKKQSDQKELESLQQGKTTFKSLLKSSSAKQESITKLTDSIERADLDIQEYKHLINFLTIYHGQLSIDKFKAEKARQYMRAINVYAIREVQNSHKHAVFFHSFLDLHNKDATVSPLTTQPEQQPEQQTA